MQMQIHLVLGASRALSRRDSAAWGRPAGPSDLSAGQFEGSREEEEVMQQPVPGCCDGASAWMGH